jgi:hypothetical protein
MSYYQKLINSIIGGLRWAARRWTLALLLMVLLLNLTAEGPPPGSLETQIDRGLTGERFDFEAWEIKAVWAKLTHRLVAPQRYLDESARHDVLLDYLALVAEAQRLDWEIYRVYADPEVDDPEAEAADLQAHLDEVRAAIDARQLLAEAILQEQVACVLVEEGFGALGQEIPPVSVHFTPLPYLLIVSPRDRIERIHSMGLRHGLDVGQREDIEEQVDAAHDVSSLVTGIGGLAAYPAMLLESSSINWVTGVTAHEWTHHYLAPRPLGWSYSTPEARIINETVASIVEKEVGRRVIARYYPEHLPPEPDPEPEESKGDEMKEQNEPPAFDFRAEMRETRVRVDELLAEGKVEEAEAYMEQRRQVFVEEGYHIRKLNQAYFAFHGAYADQPGASGADPIGPAVRDLFARVPDLHSFVAQASRVTTLEELEALLVEMER